MNMSAGADGLYLEGIKSASRATMSIRGKSNENVCAYTVAIHDHL
jgi:hypothetical protein